MSSQLSTLNVSEQKHIFTFEIAFTLEIIWLKGKTRMEVEVTFHLIKLSLSLLKYRSPRSIYFIHRIYSVKLIFNF